MNSRVKTEAANPAGIPLPTRTGGRRSLHLFLLGFLLFAVPCSAVAQSPSSLVCLMQVRGGIGPATTAFLKQGLETAAANDAQLLVIALDTPGGLSTATRDIVKQILNAPLPVATFVYPQGARAASAGTYILYSSHIAAMAPACTVGAATPIQLGGGLPGGRPKREQSPEKSGAEQEGASEPGAAPAEQDTFSGTQQEDRQMSPKQRKVINDAVAFIRGLAEKHGRNADWAEKAVREAASIKTSDAKEKNVIEFVARSPQILLQKIDGHQVEINGRTRTLETARAPILRIQPTWRTRLLSVITNPNLAYILLLVGIYGLLLEGYNPGAIVPGVVGAISLVLAFYALQILPVSFAGVGLVILGALLMVAEAFVPSFGALGLGGVVALVLGGIFLIEPDSPGFGVDPALISAVGITLGLLFLALTAYLMRARQQPVVSGREELIGAAAKALSDFENGKGRVFARGESWQARSVQPVQKGQQVRVTGLEGLTLVVALEDENP